ncbi:hypothetical protein HMPREF0789_2400 [Staphylococcus epidermidis BCM-HMP0060]|nr:hypothetical protein HMPREF0789_2400 [Staphylococcus epidermidis BCM-HMP0060]
MGRIEKFTKNNMKDILKVTNNSVINAPNPQPMDVGWGFF